MTCRLFDWSEPPCFRPHALVMHKNNEMPLCDGIYSAQLVVASYFIGSFIRITCSIARFLRGTPGPCAVHQFISLAQRC